MRREAPTDWQLEIAAFLLPLDGHNLMQVFLTGFTVHPASHSRLLSSAKL